MLQEIDLKLFHLINRGWVHPILDVFFPFWTDVHKNPFFIALVSLSVIFIIFKKQWRSLFIIFSCLLGSLLADMLNRKILKEIFQRVRPVDVILRTSQHSSYSFPSGHAVIVFFITTFLGLFFPRLRIFLFSLATLTALSRVYCGVHYPGDILAGALVGMVLAYIFYKGIQQLMINIYIISLKVVATC